MPDGTTDRSGSAVARQLQRLVGQRAMVAGQESRSQRCHELLDQLTDPLGRARGADTLPVMGGPLTVRRRLEHIAYGLDECLRREFVALDDASDAQGLGSCSDPRLVAVPRD